MQVNRKSPTPLITNIDNTVNNTKKNEGLVKKVADWVVANKKPLLLISLPILVVIAGSLYRYEINEDYCTYSNSLGDRFTHVYKKLSCNLFNCTGDDISRSWSDDYNKFTAECLNTYKDIHTDSRTIENFLNNSNALQTVKEKVKDLGYYVDMTGMLSKI